MEWMFGVADDGKRISCDEAAIRVGGLEEGKCEISSRSGAGGSLQKHVYIYIYVNQAFSSLKNSRKKSLKTAVF